MANVLIIHGSYATPKINWFPWLKNELEKLGHTVFVPQFPTPKNQNLERWMEVFKKYEEFIDENSILVGHSVGAAFVLNILETKKVKAAFLVAGFYGLLNDDRFDPIIKTISNRKFNFKKIKENCKNIFMYHSDNDSYVPLKKGQELAKKLGVKIRLIKHAGHLNAESGYTRFELLLNDIKKII